MGSLTAEHFRTWLRCDICGAIIFDKEGPREFAKRDQAERCKGACEDGPLTLPV